MMNRKARSCPGFVLIRQFDVGLIQHRAVFHTCAASGAKIRFDAAGPFSDFDLEITGRTFDRFKI
jgi:hypothetical protein